MTTGIIAEYNPFHQGHAWHIAQTRAAGANCIVVVMSSSAVQRGEFAIAQASARARAALEHGADLVIALPAPWSCARAQDFARGGVHLLRSLGCVERLSFGSESADLPLLRRAADLLKDESVVFSMRQAIGEGVSFAKARQGALAQIDPQAAALLRSPNDTLAVEYLAAIDYFCAKIEPFAVRREGARHDEIGGSGFPSASELRITCREDNLDKQILCEVPGAQHLRAEFSQGRAPVNMQRLERAWLARLRAMSLADFARLPDVSEGMEHLLRRAVREGTSIHSIISTVSNKRYPKARVRRILFHALLGVEATDFDMLPCFIRVLGCTAAGRELLRRAKTTAALPIITRHAGTRNLPEEVRRQYALECRTADLMALAMPEIQSRGMEERRQMIAL